MFSSTSASAAPHLLPLLFSIPPTQLIQPPHHCLILLSAGAEGPRTGWLNDPQAPEHKDPETFGTALFNDDGFDGWASLYSINTFSVYYVTSAFLGLLAKGSADVEGYTSSVINITSISGVLKLAQNHVRLRY